ncbi:MAG TPA: hypothetical protein DCF63_08260 [Planctomycetaceae bacterium]|nr:hypothetical protein [Planctomycetaceae bacterium]
MTPGDTVHSKPAHQATAVAGDAFMTGLLAMLVINIGQRAVGLLRNLGFCNFLTDADLGMWALANSFFMIGAPIAVLGLPGSFGKFVEHYRLQGKLRSYLIQLMIVSGLGVILLSGLMLAYPTTAGLTLYGKDLGYQAIFWTVVTLISVIGFNTTFELVVSLRLIRLGSMMHFINTTVFTGLGIAGIIWYQHWIVLLPAYSLACLLAILPGLWGAWRAAAGELRSSTAISSRAMWRRVMPFAVALWCSNLISNLFDLSDRYMLLHLCQMGAEAGQAMVGQFYCGRVLPNLLLSLAMMLAGMLLPYLSADWERAQFAKISVSMNGILTLLALAFTGLSLAAIVASPIMFQGVLSGRYQQASDILPLGMVLAAWSGLSTVAAAYLLCAEKAKQNAILLAISLVMNVILNWPLILWYGLYGAALATTVTNGLLLYLVLWRMHREGCKIKLSTLLFCGMPVCLLFGQVAAITLLSAVIIACGRTNWLLTSADRRAMDQLLVPYLEKLRLPMRSIWPLTEGAKGAV